MSTIIADNLTGKTSAGSVTVTSEGGAVTQSLQQGLVKSFVESGNHSTQTIDGDTFNVSAYTDVGLGQAQFTVTNAMGNSDYPVVMSCQQQYPYQGYASSTTTYVAGTVNSSGNFTDGIASAIVAGDLA